MMSADATLAATESTRTPLLTSDPSAFGLPGVVLQVDPDDAAAFFEDALSLEDAWTSNMDASDEGGGC